jgi:hypothetical protein
MKMEEKFGWVFKWTGSLSLLVDIRKLQVNRVAAASPSAEISRGWVVLLFCAMEVSFICVKVFYKENQ